jgi:micrococcal nuclease
MYEYKATILNVVDGDTIDVFIDLGFNHFFKDRVRLMGINTPEINSKIAEERLKAASAKKFLQDNFVLNSKIYKIKTYKDDKYGRLLAEVFMDDGQTINNKLLSQGLAVPYTGGAKT